MSSTNQNIIYGFNGENCPDKWVEAHKYDWMYFPDNNTLYWCTNYQCAEEKLRTRKLHITWHDKEYFYKMLHDALRN